MKNEAQTEYDICEKQYKHLLCPHTSFNTVVRMEWDVRTNQFLLKMSVTCSACDLPFSFQGLKNRESQTLPFVSHDATVVSLPMTPGIAGPFIPKE